MRISKNLIRLCFKDWILIMNKWEIMIVYDHGERRLGIGFSNENGLKIEFLGKSTMI